MLEQEFERRLEDLCSDAPFLQRENIEHFFRAYKRAVSSFEETLPTLIQYLGFLEKERASPSLIEPYHQMIREPIDYYQFGLDFIRPLIDLEHSSVSGRDSLDLIENRLQNKENIILLANHQTESDPQAISILLEGTHPFIAKSVIYVAGERVITDPLAIPFSLGCNLLCIYSKRYIDFPPEKKENKQLHNKKTMHRMSRLLEEGGKIIYVAPSGGRDRRNAQGMVDVAPFDPDSLEMFYLMSKKGKRKTHFFPLTLATYEMMPPPETIQREIGEARTAKKTPIHLAISPSFDMTPKEHLGKKEARKERAEKIWNLVRDTYKRFP